MLTNVRKRVKFSLITEQPKKLSEREVYLLLNFTNGFVLRFGNRRTITRCRTDTLIAVVFSKEQVQLWKKSTTNLCSLNKSGKRNVSLLTRETGVSV